MNPSEDETRLSRRLFLAGTAGTAVVTGVSASALAQEDNETDTGDGNETDTNGNETDTEDGNETAEDGGEGGESEDGNGEGDESEGDGEDNESEDGGGGGGGTTETVEVDDNEFVPDSLSVEPGTTVVWEWVGSGQHNVSPGETPDEADWEGHTDLQAEGTYEHTFDVEGTYEYVCDPHVSVGMTGSIEVAEGAGGGGEGGAISLVPDAAWTLLVATLAGVLSTLSLVYGFMRYGGDSGE
ncbi:plastocyanin/azurin family copper-binding protein [Natronosalvus halobius]|uniref:plastocyanin/azurin family copper-binding protein n=1 Tax=Natronosalvus halobius TaxID=2953746 RepID=UPI00209D1499|nr:plastocyanin/azurin family copper-binding protein [Natronosalvus halobius]USZ73167.1 plastocyanin/azurin family copper-binding protein [Natronosalvus halobius]